MTRNEFRDLDLNRGERTGSCCYSLIIYSKGITGSTNYNLYRGSNNITSTIQLQMWHHIRESAGKTLGILYTVYTVTAALFINISPRFMNTSNE